MIKQYIYKSISLGVCTLGALCSSCTLGFKDINTHPYEVNKEEMGRDAYSIASSMTLMQSWIIPASNINANQFIECLMGGSWGGYMADSNPSFNDAKFSTFCQPENWNQVMYTDVLPNIIPSYLELKESTDDEVFLSVGHIIKVAAVHRITDTYGPIPYSKIGADGKLNAPLDSQEDVYKMMFTELSDAIEVLMRHKTEHFSSNADKIFTGNVLKWVQYANSLKLRLAMRIAYADANLAQKMAEEAVNHEVGTMVSADDIAQYAGFGKDGNPLYKSMYEYNKGDSRIGADITSFMNGYQDPRREKYFTESSFTKEGIVNGFIGLRSGIKIPELSTAQSYSNINYSSNTPLVLMTPAEVAFLKAEGALRGWNMQGRLGKEWYEEGIRLSFAQWGASGADIYMKNKVNVPSVYKDPIGENPFAGEVSEITVAYKEEAGFEENLERIITQKWIAMFPLGNEAWAEFRRTGYPKLMGVVLNQSVKGSVDSKRGARRLAYPQKEYTTNGQNLDMAVSSYLKGADNMNTSVWWDCKTK